MSINAAGLGALTAYMAGGAALVFGLACVFLIQEVRALHRRIRSLEDERNAQGAMQARVAAASDAKSRFLATMSHEIRTPLNGVLGMADLMLDTRLSGEQQHYARAIKTSGEALLSLIEEILDFSRIEAGKLEITAHPVDVVGVVEGVVELLAPRAQGKSIEIAADLAPDLPALLTLDGARLRQILMNLAGNAIKFTHAGGVVLRAATKGHHLVIAVEDTGPGIAPDRLDAIFEEFEQEEAATAARHGGSGLGLAISRRLARLMGGDITVQSRQDHGIKDHGINGHGTIFSLQLPLDVVTSAPEALPAVQLAGRSVLVISAGPFEAGVLARHLAHAGASTQVVSCTDSARAVIAKAVPDLLLVDAAFGSDACRALVKAARKAGCPRHLVLLSPFERRAFGAPSSAGFDRYLVKPVRRRSLLAQVGDWEEGAPPVLEAARDTALLGQPLRGRRLLIAEDNDINALLAGKLIEHLGGRSVRASTGLEALALLEASVQPGAAPFDAMLLDIRMPDLDGLATIRRWRTRETETGTQALPALALTANAYAEDRAACLAAGFDGFLPKPLERGAFLTEIEALLGGGRRAA